VTTQHAVAALFTTGQQAGVEHAVVHVQTQQAAVVQLVHCALVVHAGAVVVDAEHCAITFVAANSESTTNNASTAIAFFTFPPPFVVCIMVTQHLCRCAC
jgi:hypothetical protein